jgi:hypothetical protein
MTASPRIPFGYVLTPDPREQHDLKTIAAMRTDGATLGAIANELNLRGVAQRQVPWTPTTILRVLRRIERDAR